MANIMEHVHNLIVSMGTPCADMKMQTIEPVPLKSMQALADALPVQLLRPTEGNTLTLVEVPNEALTQGAEYLVEYHGKRFWGLFDSYITVSGETPPVSRLVFDTGTPLGQLDQHVLVLGKNTRCFAISAGGAA